MHLFVSFSNLEKIIELELNATEQDNFNSSVAAVTKDLEILATL